VIVEFFGPPGSGKTTLAHGLRRRLAARGFDAQVLFSYRPGRDRAVVRRVLRAVGEVGGMLCRPSSYARELRIAAGLLGRLPPRNVVWFVRFWQYVMRMSHTWLAAREDAGIAIFDQALVQATCSLASLSGRSGEEDITRALAVVPKSDLVVRLDTSAEVLERRLCERLTVETRGERLLEADVATNLRLVSAAKRVDALLRAVGRPVVHLRTDGTVGVETALDRIEAAVMERLRVPPRAEAGPAHDADGEGRRFASASVWSSVVYLAGAGLTCAAQFVVARMLQAEEYGVFSYVLAWVMVLSYAVSFGFSVLVLRFVPHYQVEGRRGLARGVVRFAVAWTLLAGVLVAAAWFTAAFWRGGAVRADLTDSMSIGMVTVPLMALTIVGASVVRVFGGVIAAIVPDRIVRNGLLLAGVVAAVHVAAWPADAATAAAALLVGTAGALGWIAAVVWKRRPRDVAAVRARYATSAWWMFALPMTAVMVAQVLMTRTGTILLEWDGHAGDAGRFALAFNLALLVQLPLVAITVYFGPKASELHSRGRSDALQELLSRATLLAFVGAALLAIPPLLLAEPLLRLFGADFTTAAPLVRLLVLGQLLAAAAGPQLALMTMTGHERAAAALIAAFAAANIVACLAIIPHYGADGAAAATAATLCAWNVAMAVYIRKRLRLRPGPFAAAAELRQGATSAGCPFRKLGPLANQIESDDAAAR
jgi:O-antigen/teichoic acid export membrane protein